MKIKVLLIMPNKEVQKVKIPRSTKFIKALIGKELCKIRLNDNAIIIADKNANITEFNRVVGKNIILGTFIVVAIKNSRRVSMTKRELRKYANMFRLKKHQKKIKHYKENYLEEYYTNQKENKIINAEKNRGITSKKVA